MLFKLTCPNCGRSLLVPDSDAGLPALCNACGQRVQIPYSIAAMTFEDAAANATYNTPAHRPAPQRPPVAPASWNADARWAAALADVPSPRGEIFNPVPFQALAPRPPARVWPLYAGVGLAFLLLMLGLGTLILQAPGHDPWIAAHRAQIVSIIDDANALMVSGDAEAAVGHLNDVDRLIDQRPLDSDPLLRDIVERASRRKRELMVVVADRSAHAKRAGDVAEAEAQDRTIRAARDAVARFTKSLSARSASPSSDAQADLDPARIAPTTAPIIASAPRPPPPPGRFTTSLHATRPPRDEHSANVVTDEQIGRSIQRGVNWLIAQFGSDHLVLRPARFGPGNPRNAMDALCVYALLQCGQAIQDRRLNPNSDFVRGLLNRLDGLKIDEQTQTYGRSLRIAALAVLDRRVDRVAMAADVGWLLKAGRDGAYTYSEMQKDNFVWDNSNSQYGVLGIWSAAEVGMEVPRKYWTDVEKHWTDDQDRDGSWGYNHGSGSLAMTMAGLTSLFVCRDYLGTPSSSESVGRPDLPASIQRGLAWLEAQDRAVQIPGDNYWGYTLYALERVGLASGYKAFGGHDWYRELAAEVVKAQKPDGSWNDGDEINTSFALLFLARGRHPLLMSKLRFDAGENGAAWANRPRDVANLARFAGRELERQLNWQVVKAERDWTEWLDAPILYLASHADPGFSDDDVAKLRSYIEAGGLLYLQADGDAPEFDAFAKRLARRLFPQYPLADVPPDHYLYQILYKLDAESASLKMVSNGVRALMVYSPHDLALHWQQRASSTHPQAFQFGVNLFLYACGKSDLRNRLASIVIPEPQQPPKGGVVRVARLQYAGDWDPEPGAWQRFTRWFARETDCQIEVTTIPLNALLPAAAPLAHLTGAAAIPVSDADVEAIRRYVDGGGTLLIDSLGGSESFAASAQQFLARAFPDAPLRKLSESELPLAPLLPGMDDLSASALPLRSFTLTRLDALSASPQGFVHGKGRVIYTPLDITCGLLGTNTWGILGYTPVAAQSLLKNIVLTSALEQQ
jgi:hypothetical protein